MRRAIQRDIARTQPAELIVAVESCGAAEIASPGAVGTVHQLSERNDDPSVDEGHGHPHDGDGENQRDCLDQPQRIDTALCHSFEQADQVVDLRDEGVDAGQIGGPGNGPDVLAASSLSSSIWCPRGGFMALCHSF